MPGAGLGEAHRAWRRALAIAPSRSDTLTLLHASGQLRGTSSKTVGARVDSTGGVRPLSSSEWPAAPWRTHTTRTLVDSASEKSSVDAALLTISLSQLKNRGFQNASKIFHQHGALIIRDVSYSHLDITIMSLCTQSLSGRASAGCS
jgi:hypothetical protein